MYIHQQLEAPAFLLTNKERTMSTGKYLSLEEARKDGKLNRFCDEHPSKGKKKDFTDLLNAMAKKPESTGRTSNRKRRGGG